MGDLVNIRAILLEYAALHALRILPDSEGKMTQIAAHALSKRLPILSASVPCNWSMLYFVFCGLSIHFCLS